MVIWKKRLEFDSFSMAYIQCSWDAELLTVQVQDGKITAWFLNDQYKDQEFKIPIHIVPTGEETRPEYGKYVSTVQLNEGVRVFHLFTQDIKQGKYETAGVI